MGGWHELDQRLEELVSHSQAQEKAAQRGSRKKLAPKARVMSIEQARKTEADALEYDTKIVKGE